MKLSFRGAIYESPFPTLELTKSPIEEYQHGIDWRLKHLKAVRSEQIQQRQENDPARDRLSDASHHSTNFTIDSPSDSNPSPASSQEPSTWESPNVLNLSPDHTAEQDPTTSLYESELEFDEQSTEDNDAILLAIWEPAPTTDNRTRPFLFVAKHLLRTEEEAKSILSQYLEIYAANPVNPPARVFVGTKDVSMQPSAQSPW